MEVVDVVLSSVLTNPSIQFRCHSYKCVKKLMHSIIITLGKSLVSYALVSTQL